MFTLSQTDKDKWIEKLIDPTIKQTFGSYGNAYSRSMNVSNGNPIETCGLGCLMLAIGYDRFYSNEVAGNSNYVSDVYRVMKRLNDEEKLTLPALAEWVKTNIQVKD